ncbi:predicted lipoprotein [Psychromonas ingrahamii 37]|uniref:Predicted lipoprotein n=1 Tax=Psychromonas ingrahamii (strain DSM 17664 / CCUG 51855 / 37) TaxID=357804 RepID=A1SZA4_PSYIN|nr:DUF4136 domain-containing protein [Psychromonas ingrahamii]ABM04819.1 predicted lipoprotein [Psychromonas ingrahamii 37]
MRKTVLLVGFLVAWLSLSGCTALSPEAKLQQAEIQKEVQRITLVSSANPKNVLPAFTDFTWNNEYNLVLSAVDSKREQQLKVYIRSEIIRYLAIKGYVYQPDPVQADVVIGFLFALEDQRADGAIQQNFGLLPRLHGAKVNFPGYKQGTVMLNVLSADLKKVYWRSAMQGIKDLEKMQDDPTGKKIQSILGIMMGNFPPAGH